MLYTEKRVTLKDGQEAVLRAPRETDAEALTGYLVKRAEETDFMLRDPDECGTPEETAASIRGINASPINMMIVCEVGGAIAGCCELHRLNLRKTFHRAELSAGTLKAYWGLGIGTSLFREMIDVARASGITQLELAVFEGNERAMGLYRKLGFEVVAVRPNCVHWKDGSRLKAYSMFLSLE